MLKIQSILWYFLYLFLRFFIYNRKGIDNIILYINIKSTVIILCLNKLKNVLNFKIINNLFKINVLN